MSTDDFSIRAADYERLSPWAAERSHLDQALSVIRRAGPLGHVIDAGGGTGALARRVLALDGTLSVNVVDPSGAMLRETPEGVEATQSRFEAFTPLKPIGVVLMRQVLHYVESPTGCLEHARSILGTGYLYVGQIVATTSIQAMWLERVAHDIAPGRRRVFTEQNLLRQIEQAGFTPVLAARSRYIDTVRAWAVRSSTHLSPDEVVSRASVHASDLEYEQSSHDHCFATEQSFFNGLFST